MTRFRAAGIHLALSLLVAAILLAIMLLVWYPGGYFKLMGGGMLLFIIMGVDVCLGPLLTLAVFKSGKKSLKFDLSVIAALQLSALLYGMFVMFQARPVFTVFLTDHFKVSTPLDFDDKNSISKAIYEDFRKYSLTGPMVITAISPSDPTLKNETTFAAAGGLDLNVFPQTFAPYDTTIQKVAVKNARKLTELGQISPKNQASVEKFLHKHNRPIEDFIYLAIKSKFELMSAILDAKTGAFIEVIDADPDKQ